MKKIIYANLVLACLFSFSCTEKPVPQSGLENEVKTDFYETGKTYSFVSRSNEDTTVSYQLDVSWDKTGKATVTQTKLAAKPNDQSVSNWMVSKSAIKSDKANPVMFDASTGSPLWVIPFDNPGTSTRVVRDIIVPRCDCMSFVEGGAGACQVYSTGSSLECRPQNNCQVCRMRFIRMKSPGNRILVDSHSLIIQATNIETVIK